MFFRIRAAGSPFRCAYHRAVRSQHMDHTHTLDGIHKGHREWERDETSTFCLHRCAMIYALDRMGWTGTVFLMPHHKPISEWSGRRNCVGE